MASDHSPTEPLDASRTVDLERLRDLIYGSMSAEFATGKNGKPVTYPLTPFFDDARETIVVTSPVAYAGKANAIKYEPRVSILFHDTSGEYLVTGTAQVNTDIDENATYVRELNDREPPTPKREANEEKYEFIDSRVGHALVGWLGKRIIVEVDPVSMRRVADLSPIKALPAWPAAGVDRNEAVEYDRAVLTVVGDDGYPITHPLSSVRISGGAALIDPALIAFPRDGQPACLLLHWHDDASINLGQRLVRGRIQTTNGSLRFVPASSSTLRNDGLIDTARFIIEGKRRTRAYLRGMAQTRQSTGEGPIPPGPTGPPLVGNTAQFMRDPFRFYQELPAYGDIVRYRIGWHTWNALLHPDAIERVLVSDSDRFRRYNFEELGFDLIPDGLFFTHGEQWRRQRRAIQPAFGPAKIAPFADAIVSTTTDTIEEWDDGETIVANHEFSELTLEILTSTLFDLDLDDRRDIVTAAGRSLADRADTQSLSAFLPAWVPTPRNRRFSRRMARFNALVETLIEERRSEEATRTDLLSTLLELTAPVPETFEIDTESSTETDHVFSDEELRDQLVTLLFAGHETTALALTYVFLLVAQHDDVRRRLDEEITAVCGDRPPTIDDVPALTYTEQIIKESMRYYPPVYVLFREALEDVRVDGYLIPKGTKVVLPQVIVHADDRWWDDPHEFRPDRLADDSMDGLPTYAYFPFGGGPRHCVGMRLAMLILTLGLATIAQHVDFELESDPTPDLRLAATLAPAKDVELTVQKRT